MRFRDMPYRVKLLITHLGTVLLTVAVAVSLATLNTSREMRENSTRSLNLLTEQVLAGFAAEAENAERHLYAMGVSSGAAHLMGLVREDAEIDPQDRLELIYSLSKTIDTNAPYDHIAVLLKNGELLFSGAGQPYASDSAALLSDPEYAANRYGDSVWTRAEDGEVYLIRDVYDTSPLRHAGKVSAHLRKQELTGISERGEEQDCTILLFADGDRFVLSVGRELAGIERAASALLPGLEKGETFNSGEDAYAVSAFHRGRWTAVGLMPMAVIEDVQRSVLHSGLLAAALGLFTGVIVVSVVSRQLSRQLHSLVSSMERVEAGDLNVSIPVQSRDELGVLTEHFNRMTEQTQKLLVRAVQEEDKKRRAERMNLEYEYRFLQGQITPHFIYNTLESINALAKLDGNEDLSDMIVLLSEYFRQSTENMRRKFMPVSQVFGSLEQYCAIYRRIYGCKLDVRFETEPRARDAAVPTMILQPLMENALVHGNGSAEGTRIVASASVRDGVLAVCIRDNGKGIPQETIDRIFTPQGEWEEREKTRSSIGLRNVIDRLQLLYGDAAGVEIVSHPGEGTVVSVFLPFSPFEESGPAEEKQA